VIKLQSTNYYYTLGKKTVLFITKMDLAISLKSKVTVEIQIRLDYAQNIAVPN